MRLTDLCVMCIMCVMNDTIYKVSEVAAKLAVSEETVRRAIRRGALKAYRVGVRGYRVTEFCLCEYLRTLNDGSDKHVSGGG